MKQKLVLFTDEEQKDFSELPQLEASEFGASWSFGSGGRGLLAGQWSIFVYQGVSKTVIYPLPEHINAILNTVRQWGKDEARQSIKAALGI